MPSETSQANAANRLGQAETCGQMVLLVLSVLLSDWLCPTNPEPHVATHYDITPESRLLYHKVRLAT